MAPSCNVGELGFLLTCSSGPTPWPGPDPSRPKVFKKNKGQGLYLHLYLYLSIYLPTYLPTYLSIYLSIYIHRHTNTQRHRLSDFQTHRHTDTQTHRHTQIHRRIKAHVTYWCSQTLFFLSYLIHATQVLVPCASAHLDSCWKKRKIKSLTKSHPKGQNIKPWAVGNSQIRKLLKSEIRKFRTSEIRRSRNSAIQKFGKSKIQKFRNSDIRKLKHSKMR